jgi:hypothetical protein
MQRLLAQVGEQPQDTQTATLNQNMEPVDDPYLLTAESAPAAEDANVSGQESELPAEHDFTRPTRRLYLPVVQAGNAEAEQVTAAFSRSWAPYSCTNVVNTPTERDLWDDMPGAGAGDESGLLWIRTRSTTLDEKCTFYTWFAGISTNTYPLLRMRVAVNDGARFRIAVRDEPPGTEFCGREVWSYLTPTTYDDSSFREYQFRLPANKIICAVHITIDDDPNNVNSLRAKALIAYLRIWNGVLSGWSETFTGE